jgi:hypothetical protein
MTGPADPYAAQVAEQDAILARVVAFIHQGVRSGNISAESSEVLTAAAEKQHDEAVSRLREAGRYLS